MSNIDVPDWPQNIARSSKQPIYQEERACGSVWQSCPAGCCIKQAAASQHLLSYTGRAVVFANIADLAARSDSLTLTYHKMIFWF